ncbi:hypothetical protein SteCoe_31027 [Stentor coeruleus]|uniref:Uncharacterized protein n=1 Tax=Stentor coeruleus TaxID=5963 RepID=A0A1R2B2P5_9CILI|nr:hypothetical protein SteCoe_31027 [Stentor coeruleus]
MNIVSAKKLTLPTAKEIHIKLQQDRLKRNIKSNQQPLHDVSTASPSFALPLEVNHAEIEGIVDPVEAMSDRTDTTCCVNSFMCPKLCRIF